MIDATPATVPRLYPQQHAAQLMVAAQAKDHRRIDELTDELVELGFCRPRRDATMFESRARPAIESAVSL
jgi:hypothetical protein